MSIFSEQDILFPFRSTPNIYQDASWLQRDKEQKHDLASAFPFVPVVAIQPCALPGCKKLGEAHILVENSVVSRKHGSAVAISYTWGEFNRRKVKLGHDQAGDDVYLELGEEWDLQDLQCSLVELSRKFGGLWMDQLCIQQDTPAQKRQGLQTIPYIFRTFDVVALMPGSPCACFQTRWESIIQGCEVGKTSSERAAAIDMGYTLMQRCVNSSGLNSWFDRVWTFQEMLYSTTISALWIGKSPSACATEPSEFEKLDKYALQLFKKEIAQGFSREEAFRAVAHASMEFNGAAISLMEAYCALDNSSTADAHLNLARFFLGKPVTSLQPRAGPRDVYDRVKSFVFRLSLLGQGSRKATKARDYVLSAWVDCPGYEIPKDFNTLTAPALLENAIMQMEQKLGVAIVVNFPAGLVGRHDSTALWRPMAYLGDLNIEDTSQLFGLLSTSSGFMPCLRGRIPLAGLGPVLPSLLNRATEYRQLFHGHTTAAVLPHLQKIVKAWPTSVLGRVVAAHYRNDKRWECFRSESSLIARVFEKRILDDAVQQQYSKIDGRVRSTKKEPLDNSIEQTVTPGLPEVQQNVPNRSTAGREIINPEVDHYSIMYRLITYALGLDMATCQRHGLKLVLSSEDLPCAGLMNPELCDQLSGSKDLVSKREFGRGRLATICAQRGPETYGCTLFEAVCSRREAQSYWNVGGVWVPLSITPLHEVQFLVHVAARDGFMGEGPVVNTADTLTSENPAWIYDPDEEPQGQKVTDTDGAEAAEIPHAPLWKKILVFLFAAMLLLGIGGPRLESTNWQRTHSDSLQMCIPPREWWRPRPEAGRMTE